MENDKEDLALQKSWEESYAKLKAFYEKNGHCNDKSNSKLGRWASAQRTRKSDLSAEQITLLNEINFIWNLHNHQKEQRWESMFQLLKLFRSEKGHTRVPVKSTFRGETLGRWVYDQQAQYQKGRMKPSRKVQLEEIGLEWVYYAAAAGHGRQQRKSSFPAASTDDTGKEKLDSLSEHNGRDGNTVVPVWETMFERLKEFHSNNGHCRVPTTRLQDTDLYFWVKEQRNFFVQKAESGDPKHAERKKMLDSLGFDYDGDKGEGEHGSKDISRKRPSNSKTLQSKKIDSVARATGKNTSNASGAPGPGGDFVAFPNYSGSEEPAMWRKAFGQFRQRHRKATKASLDPSERSKERVDEVLRDRFVALPESEKQVYRSWAAWDKRRYEHELVIFKKGKKRSLDSGKESEHPRKAAKKRSRTK